MNGMFEKLKLSERLLKEEKLTATGPVLREIEAYNDGIENAAMFVEALELRIAAIVKETIAATDAIEPKNMTTLPTVALLNARALDRIMKVIEGEERA